MNTEKLQDIISIIGTERVEKVYTVIKGEKISFAALYKQILAERVRKQIDSGVNFRKIARDCHISRMTVYRIFRGFMKKSQK